MIEEDYEPVGCLTCGGIYCGPVCAGRPGHVWVPGLGWASPAAAADLEAAGRAVRWDDVWTVQRYAPPLSGLN
ncbi:MAG: hypothetical protein ACOYY2_02920 [Actinomycetota bacterium]